MNFKDYISSGVLEAYVLGQLDAVQRNEVEKYATLYPEVAEEIKQIEIALESYTSLHEKPVRPELKKKIIDAVLQKDDVIPINSSPPKKTYTKLIAIAATSLLFISIGLNVYQNKKLKETNSELSDLIAEKEILANTTNQYKTQFELEKDKVQLFQNPDIENTVIKGSEISPKSYAFVSFNKKTKQIAISGINLPEPSLGLQYQLWALVDGNPIDLGVFDSNEALIRVVNTVDNPDAFAVTLEEKGGKPTPNLNQLYLIGTVSGKTS